jgi:hypothetical protein
MIFLATYAMQQEEGPGADTTEYHKVRFYVPEETFEKLQDVGRFYRTRIDELIHEKCNAAVEEFLESIKKSMHLTGSGNMTKA